MFNPLTLPPKLILRALDDLNTLAEAARRLPEIELKVDAIVRRLESDLGAMRASVAPLEKHMIALRQEMEPIQQMAAVRQAIEPLEDHMKKLREEIAPIQQLTEVREAIVPLEGHLEALREEIAPIGQLTAVREAIEPLEGHMKGLREDIAPIGQLSDVKAATDGLEPMIEDVVRAVRELIPKLEEIRGSIEPVGDVVDNLPKFMKN